MPSPADVFAANRNREILATARSGGTEFIPGRNDHWWIRYRDSGRTVCYTPSEETPTEIWMWNNVDRVPGRPVNYVVHASLKGFDLETSTERTARLLLDPKSHPPLRDIVVAVTQNDLEINLATMQVKTKRIDHNDIARIKLARLIYDGNESPFHKNSIRLELDRYCVQRWRGMLEAWATRIKAEIEDVAIRPDSVSQLDKFRAGWVLSLGDGDLGLFTDFNEFIAARVDTSDCTESNNLGRTAEIFRRG